MNQRFIKIGIEVLVLVALIGCSRDHSKPNIELIQDMMESPAVKAQDWDPNAVDGRAMRIPPAGTVPVGFQVYKYKGDPEGSAKLANPVEIDEASLKLGKVKYDIYCAVCHGMQGKGDGTVAEKMLIRPPTLISDKVKAWPDGRIFHIVTEGQGVMGSYANQVNDPKDRWAIVNFIRQLQRE